MPESIYVNPGHGKGRNGGVDPGAVGPAGTRECDVAQQIAQRLGHLLREKGVTTLGGTVESYPDAVCHANAQDAEIFVSVHCNAATDPTAGGFEVLYRTPEGEQLARKVALQIFRQLPCGHSPWLTQAVPLRNRGVKCRADLHVLTATHMPAILVECAFISNPREEQLLRDNHVQQALAQAIADGLVG
jgi:N-acetylmuramoyl-L-alanine amidase